MNHPATNYRNYKLNSISILIISEYTIVLFNYSTFKIFFLLPSRSSVSIFVGSIAYLCMKTVVFTKVMNDL